MKVKTLLCALLISLFAISLFAQSDKVTIKVQQQPLRSVLNTLFEGQDKDFTLSNYVNGYVSISVTEKPFNTVLSLILDQVNATYEFKDGIYNIQPKQNTGMGTGMNPNGMPNGVNPAGMPNNGMMNMGGALGQPNMPNQGGAGMNPAGMGNQMGMGRNGMNGMNGQQQVPLADPRKRPINKIKVNYNSPDQILSLMDGDAYSDVVYNGSGTSNGGSNNNSSNSNNSNNSSSNSRSNNNSSRSTNR